MLYYSTERRANDGELTTAIRALLGEQYRRCQTLIEQNYEKVKTLANVLLEKNSLDEEEIVSVLEEGRKE